MIPGLPGINTGGGGLSADLGGGPSATGDQDAARGNTWNFAPPSYQVAAQSRQTSGQQWQTVALVGSVIVAAWLFTRK